MTDLIGTAEAARRLGIRPASLYSYVSRGVLTRRKAADGRSSLFDAGEVDKLARRGRPRRHGGGAELVIESALTEISDGQLRYRGFEVTGLATRRRFEEVAELLWTGTLGHTPGQWQATPGAVAVGAAARAGLPAGTLPLEQLQVIVPALAATDPLRLQLDPPAVLAAARGLIAGMVECLPPAQPAAGTGRRGVSATGLSGRGVEGPAMGGPGRKGSGVGGPGVGGRGVSGHGGSDSGVSGHGGSDPGWSAGVAGRLAPKLCPAPLTAGLAAALRAALVLLADHELAASTLAARVAASVRADPYAVVATGLGAMSGALHGGASLGAEVMLASANGPGDAARVVGDLLRRGEKIPGFGHFVYEAGDPRAVLLLGLVRKAAPGSVPVAVAGAVLAEARRRALPEPNIDFALAVLARTAGMIRGAGEAVFAIARTAGWIAHALEEYARDAPIRPRSVYTGPAGA